MANSEKSNRICQVLHGIVGGGSEQVVLNYCSRMHDMHFDVLYQYEPNQQILEKFKEVGMNCIQIPDKIHHPIMHLWAMFQIFRKGYYDVVHCHLDWYMNSYVCFLAMLAGVKKRVAHHHQAYHPANLLLKSLSVLFRAPCKLFATHWLACGEAAAINGWGKRAVAKGKVKILPNAVDPERFKFDENARKEIRARYGIGDKDFVIGHVGRFYPQKNHEFLIDVFAKVLGQKPSAKLLLLGDGPLKEKILNKVKFLKILDKVIFAGLQKDPAPFYCAMDLFCFPSLWEGLPLTLVEAQYSGLPCLVSDSITKEIEITTKMFRIHNNCIDYVTSILEQMQQMNDRSNILISFKGFDINQCYRELALLYQAP